MARRTNNLIPAHERYRYQDLVTAYAFVESLMHRYDAVIVDKKVVADDRFDDLEIVINQIPDSPAVQREDVVGGWQEVISRR
jgi:hypothetical protein